MNKGVDSELLEYSVHAGVQTTLQVPVQTYKDFYMERYCFFSPLFYGLLCLQLNMFNVHMFITACLLNRYLLPTRPMCSSWSQPMTLRSFWKSMSTCAKECLTFTVVLSCMKPWTRKHGINLAVNCPNILDAL